MSEIPRLEDLEAKLGDLSGARILVRTDFNVPLDDDGDRVTGRVILEGRGHVSQAPDLDVADAGDDVSLAKTGPGRR